MNPIEVCIDVPNLQEAGRFYSEAFVGRPTVEVTRMTEEDDVVVAEGTVRSTRRDGGQLHAAFCDVFTMENAKVTRLRFYVVEIESGGAS